MNLGFFARLEVLGDKKVVELLDRVLRAVDAEQPMGGINALRDGRAGLGD